MGDIETCLACGKPFKAGDEYLPDISGGEIHFACCGPEPECFVNLDTGEPLKAPPKPLIWEDPDLDTGHCGEGIFERQGRARHNERIERILAALAHFSRIQGENERRPPDEMTEDALTTRAKAMLAHKGWAPGDRPSLYSTMRLMVDFGLELTRTPETTRCGHPACGCDVDAVCNAALASQEQGGPGHADPA